MDVSELVAYLGLGIDEESWARGNELIEKARHGVESLGEAQHKKTKEGAEEGKELTEILKKGLEAYVGYEGIKSIGELVEGTVNATIAAKRFGERLGITSQAVQSLGYAASTTGVAAQTLQNGLQRLSYNLQAVGRGGHGVAAAFAKLGLSAQEIKKLPLDEALAKIADKFAAMPDGAAKSAASMQIFGRTVGPQLIPLLNKGADGIAELREEAQKLGVTMSDEGVKKAEEFEESQKKLQARWGAVKDQIVMAILPALTQLIDGFSKVVAFFSTHQEAMETVLGALAAAITYVGIQAAWAGRETALSWAAAFAPFLIVAGLIELIWKYIEDPKIKVALTSLAIAVGLFALAWKAVGFAAASSWAAILGPIGLVIAGIVAIVAHWDAVKGAVVDAAHVVSDAFEEALDYISNLPVIKQILAAASKIAEILHVGKGPGKEKTDAMEERIKNPVGDTDDSSANFNAMFEGSDEYKRRHTPDTGSGDTANIQVQSTVNITTGASKEDIKQAADEHLADVVRTARDAHKKGG